MTSTAGLDSNGLRRDDDKPNPPQDLPDDGSSDAIVGEEEEDDSQQRLADIAKEERKTQSDNENTFATAFGRVKNEAEAARLVEEATLPPEPEVDTDTVTPSSEGNLSGGPDDTPSVQGSLRSSPNNSVPASRASSRLGFSSPQQPFERRFKARITSSSSISRAISPAFLTSHSRQSSVSSQLTLQSQEDEKRELEEERRPWEIIRWTRLRKMSQQAFSESGRRAFGNPSFLTIGPLIALGTSKGIILLFDYQQSLRSIIGQGTAAAECGAITALAISADHSTVAGGHTNGSIFTWEVARPAKPFLHIPPMSASQVTTRSSDGHVADAAVLHVGFLGQRHTALVSADDKGMAFSHLATRGLGAVGRSVKTTRLLGRYPDSSIPAKKPSSVLAFAPLPLGNVEQVTDDFGLTALLTPFLLVIVSTTPIAQTQYKEPRTKNIAAHSAMTGCLAWFPAVKLKDATSNSDDAISRSKLVYCWSNILNVLEVHEPSQGEARDPSKRSELDFRSCGQWTCDEAILAVQWLSRSIVAIFTITQRLVILEDSTFRIADSADLIARHVFHQDLFSRQLQPLVDKIEQGDGSMHGVLPDAYHMSFKTYKGRLFLLGMNDVSMGTLSNWADRLTATLEAGNPTMAIDLATSYYTGTSDKVTIGLPDDEGKRHATVRVKLVELLASSLQYILNDDASRDTETGLRSVLQDFARTAFKACTTIDNVDFLFDQVYEQYSDASLQDVFLYELETSICESKIDIVPPTVFKDLLIWYESLDLGDRLQEIICSLQTSTMDIDQVSDVCKRLRLYDALIYVWNQALDDFVTPLMDMMEMIPEQEEVGSDDDRPDELDVASKMFPYMAYTLTGRLYPGGEEMPVRQALHARASLYNFVFAGKPVQDPPVRGPKLTARGQSRSSAYPYLTQLLHYNAFSLLSMLNEAFEDSYLNGEQEQMSNGASYQENADLSSGRPITRQGIVNILHGVVTPASFEPQDKVMLDIFLARNLAKFRQYILLPGSALRQILIELCNNPVEELEEECQLSVEYLLTIYSPNDTQEFIALLQKAGFHRVLKSAYRSTRQYSRWVQSYYEDPEYRIAIFHCIGDCLRSSAGLSKRQITEVKAVLADHAKDLIEISPADTAATLQTYAPELLQPALDSMADGSYTCFTFMQSIFEPTDTSRAVVDTFQEEHQGDYVKMMCQHRPQHVADYITTLKTGNLRLDDILPAVESSNVIDAAVTLLQHGGLARQAMERLVKHLGTLRVALSGLLIGSSPDMPNTVEAMEDILNEMDKYVKLGIWLCQSDIGKPNGQPSVLSAPHTPRRSKPAMSYTEDDLTGTEILWLDLLAVTISLHQAMPDSPAVSPLELLEKSPKETALGSLRDLVQTIFTALLVSSITVTSTAPVISQTASAKLSRQSSARNLQAQAPRFPALLSTLLTRLSHDSASSTATVLPLLSDLLRSHAFESSILVLAQQFIDKDVFLLVQEADVKRRRGWRPGGRGCEICGRRCWGPGAGLQVWEAWRKKRRGRRSERNTGEQPKTENMAQEKGKGRASEETHSEDGVAEGQIEEADALIVFGCQHLFHKVCLVRTLSVTQEMETETGGDTDTKTEAEVEYRCPVCVNKR